MLVKCQGSIAHFCIGQHVRIMTTGVAGQSRKREEANERNA